MLDAIGNFALRHNRQYSLTLREVRRPGFNEQFASTMSSLQSRSAEKTILDAELPVLEIPARSFSKKDSNVKKMINKMPRTS